MPKSASPKSMLRASRATARSPAFSRLLTGDLPGVGICQLGSCWVKRQPKVNLSRLSTGYAPNPGYGTLDDAYAGSAVVLAGRWEPAISRCQTLL